MYDSSKFNLMMQKIGKVPDVVQVVSEDGVQKEDAS
jgi:hypothetical protein